MQDIKQFLISQRDLHYKMASEIQEQIDALTDKPVENLEQENPWIKWTWTKEKPYPETLDTMVDVLFYGDTEIYENFRVEVWSEYALDNFNPHEASGRQLISHYRISKGNADV